MVYGIYHSDKFLTYMFSSLFLKVFYLQVFALYFVLLFLKFFYCSKLLDCIFVVFCLGNLATFIELKINIFD